VSSAAGHLTGVPRVTLSCRDRWTRSMRPTAVCWRNESAGQWPGAPADAQMALADVQVGRPWVPVGARGSVRQPSAASVDLARFRCSVWSGPNEEPPAGIEPATPSLPWIGGQAPCYPSSPPVAQHRECRSYVLSGRPAATLDGRATAFDRGRAVVLAGLDPVAATVRCSPGPAPGHRLRAVGRPGFAVVGDHPEAAAGQRGEGFRVVGRSGHVSRVSPAQPPAATVMVKARSCRSARRLVGRGRSR
jgi:hypothetical protein